MVVAEVRRESTVGRLQSRVRAKAKFVSARSREADVDVEIFVAENAAPDDNLLICELAM